MKMVQKIDDEIEKVLLTIPKKLYDKLLKEKEDFSYLNIQTIILEALRDRYLRNQGGGVRGRPKKTNLIRAASRKTIFKKGGDGKIL